MLGRRGFQRHGEVTAQSLESCFGVFVGGVVTGHRSCDRLVFGHVGCRGVGCPCGQPDFCEILWVRAVGVALQHRHQGGERPAAQLCVRITVRLCDVDGFTAANHVRIAVRIEPHPLVVVFGAYHVEVEQVLESERKTIDGRDGETEILSGVLADETTRLPFTDWDPHPQIDEGSGVHIENGFVREFRDAPSVHVSEFSTVTRLDRPVQVAESAPRYKIGEAVDAGGLFDVELVGNVVAVRDGSGLIERCPDCGRVVQSGQCRAHGTVEAEDDLRVKAILDDGTGTVTAILDRERTAELYGGDLEAARKHARDAMDREIVADSIREELVGRAFRVRGSLSVDEYGANLNARRFEPAQEQPTERAMQLLSEVAT